MKASWDSTWENIYRSREWGRYPPEELVRFVARNFYSAVERSKVKFLDLGCGTGSAAWFIAREGFAVYGIDGSETAIKIAKERFAKEGLHGDFRAGDIVNLDYPDNFFDCIVDISAIQHNKPENIKIILQECLRVLKPNGNMFSMMLGSKSKFDMLKNGYTHLSTKKEIESFFSIFGEAVIDVSERTDKDNFFSHFVVQARKLMNDER